MIRVNSKTEYYETSCASLRRCGDGLHISLAYSAAFGMGEKYDCLDHKGKKVINEVEEKFCFQGDKTYNPAPFFWTDAGWGLYADTCQTTVFDFSADAISIELPAGTEIVLFQGQPDQIVKEYMSLFGPAILPPEWAFGVWISANRWNTQREAEAQLEKLQKYGFPLRKRRGIPEASSPIVNFRIAK